MKILHVIDGFFLAGIENQAFEIIRNYPEDNKSFLLNTNSSIKYTFEKFNSLKKQKKLIELKNIKSKFSLQLIYLVFRYLKKNKIEALIIYPCHKKMIYVVIAARLAGIEKIFISVQNVVYKKNNFEIYKIKTLFAILNRLNVCFVAASKSILSSMQILNINLKKYEVIYNSCDVTNIQKTTNKIRSFEKKNKEKVITMIARLDQIKDHETLLRAFSNLDYSDWKLKIIGEGSKSFDLKRLAKNLGLNPELVFCGERTDIPEILSQTNIFAFSTTEAEGFGIVLIEAMAANLPIIASDVSACREILLQGKAGMLVPPADIKAWENSLRELMLSSIKREKLSENLCNYVQQYDSHYIVRKWHKLLNSRN
ncbi:glycosyltransferase [Prochlorococcus marinus XMU1410]|uniref:glycosyltransferase n=1 Tax=Prochlorococcus marinus TaxID=1219 RepID=UPI001ADB86ED|nr:glycosyltransferase [Prochlorococcus marinus]MBO8242387.1 glycosyltransferase [Prochlorococcus marinus XMU1410]MBW3053535.1 hypothetical protein [Prochlorococcus marinus str. MU1410]